MVRKKLIIHKADGTKTRFIKTPWGFYYMYTNKINTHTNEARKNATHKDQ